jgi:hypothetical protein
VKGDIAAIERHLGITKNITAQYLASTSVAVRDASLKRLSTAAMTPY